MHHSYINRRIIRTFILSGITSATILYCLFLSPAQALPNGLLAAHKATYKLTMHHSTMSSDVVGVKGRLEVSFKASCDGWKIEQFLGFKLYSQETELLEHIAHISSFESLDGSEFIFTTRAFEDRKLSEELSGIARRQPADRERVLVRYSRPKKKTELLPADTLFPGQHVEQILAAAKAGQRLLRNTVFDGSTQENPFEISTFLGKPRIDTISPFKELRDRTLWPIRLAYYKVGAVTPAADFEMAIQLYDHGVAGDMLYDYGNFSVDVKLQEIEILPMPSCPD